MIIPPKPPARAEKVSLWRYLRLFKADLLSAQPAKLYRAWMAEFRSPFFHSFLCNDPALIRQVLQEAPEAFPKSPRVGEGLRPLLGGSIFVTTGEEWARQRRIIDPAFQGGRLKAMIPVLWAAAEAAAARLPEGEVEVEAFAARSAADVIFRLLFSIPIEAELAEASFQAFRRHQRAQPLVNLGAFLPLPRFWPRFYPRAARHSARELRGLIGALVEARRAALAAGAAPDDLASRLLTTPDPETGTCLSPGELAAQVAIFFIAGHETSASALAWALYLLAEDQEAQARAAAEAAALPQGSPSLSDLSKLPFLRDVFRETLRLYPPVPMMVRQAARPVVFRGRNVPQGAQVILSPWHLHRHERLWENPDAFDPGRWARAENDSAARQAYLPFSAGPRVCIGAGLAMAEGVLMLAALLRRWSFAPSARPAPRPVAHLTLRAESGIYLAVRRREGR